MKIESPEEEKTGFDFIEYPCEYDFKAVCRVNLSAAVTTSEMIRELVLGQTTASSILAVKCKPSKAGKFESVTVTVALDSKLQLEAIYTALSDSPLVVMTL